MQDLQYPTNGLGYFGVELCSCLTAREDEIKGLFLNCDQAGSAPTLTLKELPKPAVTANHVLVKVRASAIHPSDLINARGGFAHTSFPRVPGRDFAGTIVEGPDGRIGEDVYGTSGHTRAFTVDGSQAEYTLVHEDAVARKPKNLSFAQAACVGVPFTTASLALRRTNATSEDVVLVLGANGAVGSATVQLAKGKGCRVISATRNDDEDINTAKDPELNGLDALTGGKGVDVIIDTVGQPALMRAAVGKLARGGRLGFIAAPRSGATDVSIECLDFYRKEKSMIGCNTLLYSVEEFAAMMQAMTGDFEKGLLEGAKEGEWTVVGLDGAVEAYERAKQRGAGKFVIVMDE